jgi:diaminopimelate dehydrogenase
MLAKNNKQIALCSFGWDPGLFSLMRGLFDSLGFNPYTFWGKGLSQGHTQAIKNVDSVIDGLQFTIPNKKIINKIKHGENLIQNKSFHTRQCYIVCDKKNRETIKQKIVSMPDYFAGYKTKVNFVSQQKLDSLKNFSHKGFVTTRNRAFEFSLNTKSNPNLTAKIMITFAQCYAKLKRKKSYGAFTIFDLPFGYILSKTKSEYL